MVRLVIWDAIAPIMTSLLWSEPVMPLFTDASVCHPTSVSKYCTNIDNHNCRYYILSTVDKNISPINRWGANTQDLVNQCNMMTSSNGNIFRVTGHL